MPGSRTGFDPQDEGFEMKRHTSYTLLNEAGTQRYAPEGLEGATDSTTQAKLWELMGSYLKNDKESLQTSFVNHVEYTLACTRYRFGKSDAWRAAAFAIRDRLIENFNDTNEFFGEVDPKRGYYLSMEFLVGRLFQNAVVNMQIEPQLRAALSELGFALEELYEVAEDPSLGNGGLGRLAACFLDSMATLNLPCWGYGLRYQYGIFKQRIIDGRQYEVPDHWDANFNPWEIVRPDVTYGVRFYGHVTPVAGSLDRFTWSSGEVVSAVAYDNLVPGYGTFNCINLRLWKSEPSKEFDFQAFNAGRYQDAVLERHRAQYLTSVLYPNDSTYEGKELRLKQQYFSVCATLQDILRRFKKKPGREWRELPDKVAIQINDTHPALAIPEMMRILVDIEGLEWHFAWSLVVSVFNYTNHTVLPEALEKWDVTMLGNLLPRHLLIINKINQLFLDKVAVCWGWNSPAIARMSIYEEPPAGSGGGKKLRMANLAVIGSNKVNGVAAIHSEIVKKDLFPDFHAWFGSVHGGGHTEKFINVTNGVTPRLWLFCANRDLADLIDEFLGQEGGNASLGNGSPNGGSPGRGLLVANDSGSRLGASVSASGATAGPSGAADSSEWLTNLPLLRNLIPLQNSPLLQERWARIKYQNKQKLAEWVFRSTGVRLDPESLFDMQVKRVHEYKRQLLFVFGIVERYIRLKGMSPAERAKMLKRSYMLGGKAAPSYEVAKTIIKLVNNIGEVVNNDPETKEYMKVVFLANYNVANAQVFIPAADLNEQISTAGTEASGTGNMKFVMNGSLIIGTLDGANVEIREEAGEETMFVFGAYEHEVEGIREKARRGEYPMDKRLEDVFKCIKAGTFSLGDENVHREFCVVVDRICNNGHGVCGDHYLVIYDFPSYIDAQRRVDEAYKDPKLWWALSIQATASIGKFSTDRTIQEYAKGVWGLKSCRRPVGGSGTLSEASSVIHSPTLASAVGLPTGQLHGVANAGSGRSGARGSVPVGAVQEKPKRKAETSTTKLVNK